MAPARNRPRVRTALTLEPLEGRQLPSTLAAPTRAPAEVRPGPAIPAPSLFTEPDDGRGPILRAIRSARASIRVGICNLSDPAIGDALAAANARGVDIRVIVDRADYLAKPPEQAAVAALRARGVEVHLSNPVFPQSFEKYVVVDKSRVLIMTLCLVPETFEDTRDFGVALADRAAIREITSVFDADWKYSAPPGGPTPPYNPTPPLRVPALIWGPTDATAKLSALIQSARRSIRATSELLGDPYLEGQLIAAAGRGVDVRLIAPAVPREGGSNAASIASLRSYGIGVRVTEGQAPPPGALPYMHAKTMVVDGRTAYLGSIDLQTNPATRNRELGVLLRQPGIVRQLRARFEQDWAHASGPA